MTPVIWLAPKDMVRFWSNVETGAAEDCWPWRGGQSMGYGIFSLGSAPVRAHRLSLAVFGGGVADDLMACHKCHNKLCVNPGHLYAGTASDNLHDTISSGRHGNGDRRFWKFSADEGREMYRLWTLGYTYRFIGRKFGCKHGTVKRYCEQAATDIHGM